jgi:UDP-glucuronate 4-epimerase
MARWLVTGGVGFIGFHVSQALAARGDDVVVVDDFSDAPYPTRMKERNERDLTAAFAGRARVVRACVTDRATLAPLVTGVDGVVHLAGLAGVRPSFAEPARYARVNVEGTAVVLELARAAGVKKFLLASSSSVYGNSTPLPAREDAPCIVPESPYAASKRGAELVAASICKRAPDLACVALRFFTVYGARQRPEMAITLFMRAILRGEPITVFGDGTMKRDFTHVDDITRGVVAALDGAKPGYEVYNLGSGAPIDLDGLVDALSRAAGKPANIRRAPVPAGDVDATFADIDKMRRDHGWSPRVKLTDGIVTVRDWVSQNP